MIFPLENLQMFEKWSVTILCKSRFDFSQLQEKLSKVFSCFHFLIITGGSKLPPEGAEQNQVCQKKNYTSILKE